jgi:hypothetical protein
MALLQLGEQFAGVKTWSEKRRFWTDPLFNTAEMNNSISCVSLSCKSDHDYRLNWNPSWVNGPWRQIVMGRHECLCDSLSVICSLLSQLGASSQLVRSQLRSELPEQILNLLLIHLMPQMPPFFAERSWSESIMLRSCLLHLQNSLTETVFGTILGFHEPVAINWFASKFGWNSWRDRTTQKMFGFHKNEVLTDNQSIC